MKAIQIKFEGIVRPRYSVVTEEKDGYDFNKDRRRAQIDHTISALNIAIKEYNRL